MKKSPLAVMVPLFSVWSSIISVEMPFHEAVPPTERFSVTSWPRPNTREALVGRFLTSALPPAAVSAIIEPAANVAFWPIVSPANCALLPWMTEVPSRVNLSLESGVAPRMISE